MTVKDLIVALVNLSEDDKMKDVVTHDEGGTIDTVDFIHVTLARYGKTTSNGYETKSWPCVKILT